MDTVIGMTTATGTERVLRPLRHLPWRMTAAGNIGLFVPGAGVAVWLALQDGRPVVAAVVVAVVLGIAAFVIVPALRIRTRLDGDGITTFWIGRHRTAHLDRERVARAVVRTIYNGDGISTNRHLFLLDADERPVHRMSTRWWTDEQLLTVAHHFAVPLDSQAQPMHLAEVRRVAGSHLRWAERHRATALVATLTGGFLLCVAFAWLTTAAV
jgi:hypothetical protein